MYLGYASCMRAYVDVYVFLYIDRGILFGRISGVRELDCGSWKI
jgi:hypothetical protein